MSVRPPPGSEPPDRAGRRPPEPAGNRRPGLTPKQEAVAVALAAGSTVTAAARRCSVGERTVREWQAAGPEFAARVRQLRAAMTDRVVGLLAAGSAEAVTALRRLLRAKGDGAKQRAAEALLTHALKARELAEVGEIAGRLTALEVTASALPPAGRVR